MKEVFYEYNMEKYGKIEDIIKNGSIFLDANALLDLYRLSNETRDKFFEILKSVNSRLYITYQVGREFYNNRPGIIYKKSRFKSCLKSEILKNLKSLNNIIENINFQGQDKEICNLLKHEDSLKKDLMKIIINSQEEITKAIDEYNIQIDKKLLYDEDPILNQILGLFEGHITEAIPEEQLNQIYKDGKERYDKKIPPGYEDQKDKKEPQRYGDLVIWNELIKFAQLKKRDILFVSNDRKEDWCEILDKDKKEDLGPRKELIREFKDKTGYLFYSLTTTNFIKHISETCNITNTEKLEEESEIIREELQENKNVYIKRYFDLNIGSNFNFDDLLGDIVSQIEEKPEIFTSQNIGAKFQNICPVCECERTFEIIEDGKVKCLECETEMKLNLNVEMQK